MDGSPVAKRAAGGRHRQVQRLPRRSSRCTAKTATRPSIASCAITRAIQTASTAESRPINFSLMVHKIHYGENMARAAPRTRSAPTTSATCASRVMSNTGTPGDTAKCYMCHVNGSEAVFPIGLNTVKTPQGLMNPMAPPRPPAPPAT